MAKFHGPIGYGVKTEVKPGVWKEEYIERTYSGDYIRNIRKLQSADQVNDNVNIANKISIVADPYARDNFFNMRYAKSMGVKWKVLDVEVNYPRLILTLGGVFNG